MKLTILITNKQIDPVLGPVLVSVLYDLIVQLENQKKLSKDQRKEIHELKVVAEYFIDRLNNRMLIVDDEYTIH